MPFLIEICPSNSNKSHYLYTDKKHFFLNEDKFGFLEVTDSQNLDSEISIGKLTGSDFEVKYKKLNQRHSLAAKLELEANLVIFYCISHKAQYLSKLASLDLVKRINDFSLVCSQLDINLPLYRGTEISIGSSQYDSITVIENGVQARHLEIKICHSLHDCSVKACTGKVNSVFYSHNKISFTLSNKVNRDLEFEIISNIS